jgi:hypothetical protein
MFPQLLDGCVQRQQASNHDESFAVHTDDSVSEEKIPVGLNSRTFDQRHGAEFSFHDCPASADDFSADGSGFVSVLQDTVFLQQCVPSEEFFATADVAPPPTAAHEADPFHDDWPYWNQTSTRLVIRHNV